MATLQVSIPTIRKEQVTLTIVGDTSLISNCFSDEAKQAILNKQMKKAATARKAKDPEALYLASIYRTDDGLPGFPAAGIKNAAVYACRFLDMKMTEARGAFFVMGEILPVIGEPRMREDMVRIGQGKSADIRYRAEFPEWSITFDVRFNPDIISIEGIANLLETAGFHIGIEDWRPEKNGTHGMFHVERSDT